MIHESSHMIHQSGMKCSNSSGMQNNWQITDQTKGHQSHQSPTAWLITALFLPLSLSFSPSLSSSHSPSLSLPHSFSLSLTFSLYPSLTHFLSLSFSLSPHLYPSLSLSVFPARLWIFSGWLYLLLCFSLKYLSKCYPTPKCSPLTPSRRARRVPSASRQSNSLKGHTVHQTVSEPLCVSGLSLFLLRLS